MLGWMYLSVPRMAEVDVSNSEDIRIVTAEAFWAYSLRFGWIYLNRDIFPYVYTLESAGYVYATDFGWYYDFSSNSWELH